MDLFGTSGADSNSHRMVRKEERTYNASGTRILLVEDNEMNQQIARELLESAGAHVTIAGHGGEAVKFLREGPEPPEIDVVLMDLQMPEMDGYTATGLLRADPRFKDLPIIAMTAHAFAEERQRCLDAGMNDHLTKPIDLDAVFSALKRWTKPRETRAVAATPAAGGPPPAQEEVALPDIEGIDGVGGLKRVAGNRRLYRSLMEQFVTKHRDAGAQIANALKSGDRELAGRIAHTVKGVAGNLGIGPVQSVAEKVERAIREDVASAGLLLDAFGSTLGSMVEAIQTRLGSSKPASAADRGPFDVMAASAAVNKLKALIEANDGGAAEAYVELEHTLTGVVEKSKLDVLREAIDDFDFDKALTALDDISQQSGFGKN
jgi:CheY-like chemotaxis protein